MTATPRIRPQLSSGVRTQRTFSRRLLTFVALLVLPGLCVAQRGEGGCDHRTNARDRNACLAVELDSAAARLYRSVGQTLEGLPDSARRTFLSGEAEWARQQFARCRERIRGLSSGPDEDRIDAECRRDAANARADYLRQRYALGGTAFAHGGCVGYGPDTVMLVGRLERRTDPGATRGETGAPRDGPDTRLYLVVSPGVCVTRNLNKVNEPIVGVTLLQLVTDSPRRARLLSSVGKQVTLRGVVSHSTPYSVIKLDRNGSQTATIARYHAELLLQVVK